MSQQVSQKQKGRLQPWPPGLPPRASWGALLTLPGLAQTPQLPSRAPQLCVATRHVSAMANTTSQRTSVDGSKFPNFLSTCLFSH